MQCEWEMRIATAESVAIADLKSYAACAGTWLANGVDQRATAERNENRKVDAYGERKDDAGRMPYLSAVTPTLMLGAAA